MRASRRPPVMLKTGAAEQRTSSVWPGWATRRVALFNYFAGVFFGTTAFVLYFRAAHPYYEIVQYQVTLLQFALSGVVLVWFVPAMLGDFERALHRSSPRLRVAFLQGAVWPLLGNTILLASMAAVALMPLMLLLPEGVIVRDYVHTAEAYSLLWSLHVFIANLVFLTYLIMAVAVGTAVLMLLRSLILYRLILVVLLALWLFSEDVTLQLWHTLANAPFSLESVWQLVVRGGFTNYFGDFVTMVGGGRYAFSVIHLLWVRIVLEVAGRLIGALVLASAALWLAAAINEVVSALRRRRGEPLRKRHAVANPWFALLTCVLAIGALVQPLLRTASVLPTVVRDQGGSGTAYSLLLLGLILAVVYILAAAGADAVQSGRRSGLGQFLPEVIRRFHRNGAALAVSVVLGGVFYLAVAGRALGYGSAALVASVVLLLLVAVVALVVGTAIIAFGRLTRDLGWLTPLAEGITVALMAAATTFFLFLRDSPERLVGVMGKPEAALPQQVAEALRLGSTSYMALVGSWLDSFEAASQGAGGLWHLLVGVAAVIAALAVATNLLARLTRRLA